MQDYDIGISSAITELIESNQLQQGNSNKAGPFESILNSYFNESLESGGAFNLIDGRTLLYGNSFLSKFFKNIVDEKEQYYVISIIGSQSSAKSTLLNHLFGCGFETSAGRCTKGVYFTIIKLK